MKKKKVLVLSDHALSTSGVGTQTRHLINGLLEKYPGQWTFRQFGAAIKHQNYDTIKVNEDFIIKPTDGFGNPAMIRQTLAIEKPDLIFIFTDPRFFEWLFAMEDEIHQMCPIVWWHVWDNYPFPDFNSTFYEATDGINCHSYLTYEMVQEHFPQKTKFIPHALPESLFFELNYQQKLMARMQLLGPQNKDDFVLFWMNRNARRKRPADLIWAWKMFIDRIKQEGKSDAKMILHTDPKDTEGPDLAAVANHFDVNESVIFSTDRISFEKINVLHNVADCTINISYAEGFGLSTLEAMQTGTPIIAPKTGGQTRQVVDHRDGSHNGVALDIDFQTMVGSQQVPFILEDYCSPQKIADAIYKIYSMDKQERIALGQKCKDYVKSEFSYGKTIDLWHESMVDTIENWESRYERWKVTEK